jgi:hypothetical protein
LPSPSPITSPSPTSYASPSPIASLKPSPISSLTPVTSLTPTKANYKFSLPPSMRMTV